MVWGMRMPSGNGKFSPEGDHGSWKEDVQKYFSEKLSNEERAEFNNFHVDYRATISKKFVEEGGIIKPHEWPTEFCLSKTYSDLGSLIEFHNRLLGVDEKLKSIIEKLEPDVHQFSPIKITMPKEKEYSKQYYAMVVSTFHDSFSPEESDVGAWYEDSYEAHWGERITQYYVDIPKKEKFAGLAIDDNVYGKSHLWREQKLLDPDLYISDELHAEIVSHDLRVPQMYQLKEVQS